MFAVGIIHALEDEVREGFLEEGTTVPRQGREVGWREGGGGEERKTFQCSNVTTQGV